MYSAELNGTSSVKCSFKIESGRFEAEVDGQTLKGDWLKINPYQFHLLLNKGSYSIDVLRFNREEKHFLLRINSKRVQVKLKDKFDDLLHTLGLDETNQKKVNTIKAPMPGMVLNVLVKDGDIVKKGDAILVLEAMKMENILKSPSDGTIKKIAVSKGTAVEKNQLLVQF